MAFDVNNINLTETFKTDISDVNETKAKNQVFISFSKLTPSNKNSEIYLLDDELKTSIKEDGLIHPLIVKQTEDDKYEILSGNRRYLAFKSLIEDNNDFVYKFMGNKMLSPIIDGLPCIIVRRELSDDDTTLLIISANKNRDYDQLEIYRMVRICKEIYDRKKEDNEILRGEGREIEWIARRTPISAKTVQRILNNEWVINEDNQAFVENAGSYTNYCDEELVETPKSNSNNIQKQKLSAFDKEYAYLDKLSQHHEKLDFDKLNIHGSYYDDLRSNAINSVNKIMATYNIKKGELK